MEAPDPTGSETFCLLAIRIWIRILDDLTGRIRIRIDLTGSQIIIEDQDLLEEKFSNDNKDTIFDKISSIL